MKEWRFTYVFSVGSFPDKSGRPDGMLRPPGLPHHRTCGFPHPAIGDERGLTREVVPSLSPASLTYSLGSAWVAGMPLSLPLRMAAPSGRFGFAQCDVVPHLGLLTFGRCFRSTGSWSLCSRSFGPSLRRAFTRPPRYYGLC